MFRNCKFAFFFCSNKKTIGQRLLRDKLSSETEDKNLSGVKKRSNFRDCCSREICERRQDCFSFLFFFGWGGASEDMINWFVEKPIINRIGGLAFGWLKSFSPPTINYFDNYSHYSDQSEMEIDDAIIIRRILCGRQAAKLNCPDDLTFERVKLEFKLCKSCEISAPMSMLGCVNCVGQNKQQIEELEWHSHFSCLHFNQQSTRPSWRRQTQTGVASSRQTKAAAKFVLSRRKFMIRRWDRPLAKEARFGRGKEEATSTRRGSAQHEALIEDRVTSPSRVSSPCDFSHKNVVYHFPSLSIFNLDGFRWKKNGETKWTSLF